MLKSLVKKHLAGCVMIVSKNNENYKFVCTAFICSSKGYLLTCAHAIDLSGDLYLALPDDTSEYKSETLGAFQAISLSVTQYDPLNDVALLKINHKPSTSISMPPPSLTLSNEDNISLGASVGYFGYPFAARGLQTIKVSSGIISSKILSSTGTKKLQIDTIVNDGNSGGPLFDLESERIIGIISGRYSPTGANSGVSIGGFPIGQDSNISYATGISYGIALLIEEGIYE